MANPKEVFYADLLSRAQNLLAGERDHIANLSNIAALVYHGLNPSTLGCPVNWTGFYLHRGRDELVLGPFQGKVACVRIKQGKGVCGACWAEDKPMLVPDVHAFPGHIACDSESNAELVLPLKDPNGRFLGVFDLDSVVLGQFDAVDVTGLSRVLDVLSQGSDWAPLIDNQNA